MRGVNILLSDKELAYIKRNSKKERKPLTERFNKIFDRELSVYNIQAICARNGWKAATSGRYKKGCKPYNRGLKLDKGANQTSFVQGHKPNNMKPIGYERINMDGYIEIKVEYGRTGFRLKHREIWKQHNGDLDKKEVIRFKDNDKLNCEPDNLYKVTRHENLLLNKADYANEHESLKPVVKSIVHIDAKTYKNAKNIFI